MFTFMVNYDIMVTLNVIIMVTLSGENRLGILY